MKLKNGFVYQAKRNIFLHLGMGKTKKWYVVWVGVNPGIYDSWAECKAQIQGYPEAKYKSFPSIAEAQEAFRSRASHYLYGKKATVSKTSPVANPNIIKYSLSVDAACSGNPGLMEYRGVRTSDGKELFRKGPFKRGTNNIGEFLALVHGLAFLKQIGKTEIPIYSDSKTAMAWVRNKKVKTSLQKTAENEILFDLIDRGEKWLYKNPVKTPILKWDTKKWGEIPADFGRK